MLEWKPDSSGFLCYYRIFNGLSGDDFQKFPRYVSFDISNGAVYITELSDSDIGKAGDLCYFATSDNVLSLAYLELFNGQTGTLTGDRSLDVPLIAEVMFGRDENGDMYFADLDGSNFGRSFFSERNCKTDFSQKISRLIYSYLERIYMKNKIELLEKVLKKYRPDLDEQKRALISRESTKIESSGRIIYDALKQMNEEEKVLYLGSLSEAEHMRQHLSYMATYPKLVSPVHERRAKRP
ncbi:MAG: hypothetical protein IMF20_05660 [Proteobacteria bacterium]|nr:hypothetical protein [Pseudomonadota bacterium]